VLDRKRVLFDGRPLFFLGAATGARLIAGFVVLKYLAWQFGPADFGVLTQIMSVAAIFYMFAGGGITNGLIRNISAAPSSEERRHWISAGTMINVLASIVLATIALALAAFGGGAAFGDPAYGTAYFGIAFGQALVGFGNLGLAYFSGIGQNQTFAAIHITANVLSTLLLIALTSGWGFFGAIFAVVLGPAMIGVVTIWFRFYGAENGLRIQAAWEWLLLKTLLSYGAATACAIVAVPLAQLMIRLDMGEHLGWRAVGLWQGVAKISDAYMLFIGVLFINYLLPQMARRRRSAEALQVLRRFALSLLPTFILAGAAIYLMREYVILIVYSRQFLPGSELILPQVTGDTLKVAFLLPHYYFMAQGRILIVMVSELAQGILLYIIYRVLAPLSGMSAPVYAHIATYALMLILMVVLACINASMDRARSRRS
jgi:O-antigen/teichoic acid export membrane protein